MLRRITLVRLISQYHQHIHARKNTTLLFIPCRADALIFKKFDFIIRLHYVFPIQMCILLQLLQYELQQFFSDKLPIHLY